MRLVRSILDRFRVNRTVVRAGRRNIRGSATHHAEQMINCHYS